MFRHKWQMLRGADFRLTGNYVLQVWNLSAKKEVESSCWEDSFLLKFSWLKFTAFMCRMRLTKRCHDMSFLSKATHRYLRCIYPLRIFLLISVLLEVLLVLLFCVFEYPSTKALSFYCQNSKTWLRKSTFHIGSITLQICPLQFGQTKVERNKVGGNFFSNSSSWNAREQKYIETNISSASFTPLRFLDEFMYI